MGFFVVVVGLVVEWDLVVAVMLCGIALWCVVLCCVPGCRGFQVRPTVPTNVTTPPPPHHRGGGGREANDWSRGHAGKKRKEKADDTYTKCKRAEHYEQGSKGQGQ